MTAPEIRVERLSYRYPDGQPALRDVSLCVPAGRMLGVLGPNGAGKSTLLLHLNGLLRGKGEIRLGELALTDRTLGEFRRRVGLVFQDPDDQLFMPTVYEDVAFGPRNQGLAPEEVRACVEEALATAGIPDLGARPPHHLSLGQKKRAALATVLAMRSEVLVLDEPTSGLDPRGRRELGAFLAALPQTRLMATHDLEFALSLCDRIVILDGGEVLAEGPAPELLADAELMERAGLEVPFSLRRG
jgi:cobalt transport protein ATP-binding subunit